MPHALWDYMNNNARQSADALRSASEKQHAKIEEGSRKSIDSFAGSDGQPKSGQICRCLISSLGVWAPSSVRNSGRRSPPGSHGAARCPPSVSVLTMPLRNRVAVLPERTNLG